MGTTQIRLNPDTAARQLPASYCARPVMLTALTLCFWLQLEGVPSLPSRTSAPKQASQAVPPAGYPPPQPNRNSNPFNPQSPPPTFQSGAPDPDIRPPIMSDYNYKQPSGQQYAYPGQADSPQSSYQPSGPFTQRHGYEQQSDYGRSSSDNARADAGFARASGSYSRPNAEPDWAMEDTGVSRGGMQNNRGPSEDTRGYPKGKRGYSEGNRGYSEGSRGYPEGNQSYGRQPVMAAGQGLGSTAAQPASPSAADAKKATYRCASI